MTFRAAALGVLFLLSAPLLHATERTRVLFIMADDLRPELGCYGSAAVTDKAYYGGRVAEKAVRVLRKVKDQPFFLAVGFWKPHAPFNPPKKYWDMYQRDKPPACNPARPAAAQEIAFHQSAEILGPTENQKQPTPEQVAEMRHGYMDAQLGKVIAALEKHGLLDSTLIVFRGDHGYHLGEHGLWAKTSNFELDVRVPLIIAPPKARHSGASTDAMVEMLDLFPTFTALCGVPAPPPVWRAPASCWC